jgi:hypothetical protein
MGVFCSTPTLLNERQKWKSPISTKHYYLFLNIIRDYKSCSGIIIIFDDIEEEIIVGIGDFHFRLSLSKVGALQYGIRAVGSEDHRKMDLIRN